VTANGAMIDVGDGLRLHVERSGGGPPLVLLHGFTGSSGSWTPLRAALDASSGGRVATLAVDLPGHGRSDAPADPARYALHRFADDLARLLDALDIARTAVLGYSMGGRAALRFALRHPDRVAALALESASPGLRDDRERSERVAADRALADAIERDGIAAFVDAWERRPVWESQAALPEETRARLRAQRSSNRPGGLASSLRGAGAGVEPGIEPPDLLPLTTRRTPVLVVAGALDAPYVASGEWLADAMPQAHLRVVAGSGHAVHLERPAELAGLMATFLAGVPALDGRWR
jgi:2-succinyl-6-hydroxy-2,4-cyclohexadiene-1-carboxylate synthase